MSLRKALRRAYLRNRIARCAAELEHLERVRQAIGPAVEATLAGANAARAELLWMDIPRATRSVAMSSGVREGVVRPIVGKVWEVSR